MKPLRCLWHSAHLLQRVQLLAHVCGARRVGAARSHALSHLESFLEPFKLRGQGAGEREALARVKTDP
jgi:hypothetical protein